MVVSVAHTHTHSHRAGYREKVKDREGDLKRERLTLGLIRLIIINIVNIDFTVAVYKSVRYIAYIVIYRKVQIVHTHTQQEKSQYNPGDHSNHVCVCIYIFNIVVVVVVFVEYEGIAGRHRKCVGVCVWNNTIEI